MLNYNDCSNFDEVKSEMDNINSISYKNEDSMSDMGFNNSYELSFSPINLPVSNSLIEIKDPCPQAILVSSFKRAIADIFELISLGFISPSL